MEHPWADVHKDLPRKITEVELLREDGSTTIGYYYKSSKTGITWVNEEGYRIIYNPVIAWRPTKTFKRKSIFT